MLKANLFSLLWLGWGFYWWISARGGKAIARRESLGSRLGHLLPLVAAGYLEWAERLPGGFLGGHLYAPTAISYGLGLALTAGGLLFCVWARLHLGRNWSGTVTVKEDHELVRTGPYGLVRHPIYTGLLLAFLGTAVARAEWRGLVAVLLVFAALWRKLRLEERWMGETFGPRYAAYKREVKALVPFLL